MNLLNIYNIIKQLLIFYIKSMKILKQELSTVTDVDLWHTEGRGTDLSKVHGINFFKKDGMFFSIYYVKNDHLGNDVICEIRDSRSTYYTKINDHTVSANVVKHYLPQMLLVKFQNDRFLIVVIPEKVGKRERRNLLMKIYKVHYSPSISLVDTSKIYLSGTDGATKERVKYPIILTQDGLGRVVVIARTDYDVRGDAADRLYVMWKLKYEGGKFKIIKPRSDELSNRFNNEYLFKYSGYMGYDRYPDRLVHISEFHNSLNFLYVGQYFSNYKLFSNIYEISVPNGRNFKTRNCLVNPFHGCSVTNDSRYPIPVSSIDAIDVVRSNGNTYIAYVGIVSNSKYRQKQLVIVRKVAGKTVCVYDFAVVQEQVNALYINYIGNSIVVVTVGKNNIVRYEMSELQLRFANVAYVDVIPFQRSQIKNITDFVYVVTGNVPVMDDVTYTSVSSVSAKNYGNTMTPSFTVYIREIQSKGVLQSKSYERFLTHNLMPSYVTPHPLQLSMPDYPGVENVTDDIATHLRSTVAGSITSQSVSEYFMEEVSSSTHSIAQGPSKSITQIEEYPTVITREGLKNNLPDRYRSVMISEENSKYGAVASRRLKSLMPDDTRVRSVARVTSEESAVTELTTSKDVSEHSESVVRRSTRSVAQDESIGNDITIIDSTVAATESQLLQESSSVKSKRPTSEDVSERSGNVVDRSTHSVIQDTSISNSITAMGPVEETESPLLQKSSSVKSKRPTSEDISERSGNVVDRSTHSVIQDTSISNSITAMGPVEETESPLLQKSSSVASKSQISGETTTLYNGDVSGSLKTSVSRSSAVEDTTKVEVDTTKKSTLSNKVKHMPKSYVKSKAKSYPKPVKAKYNIKRTTINPVRHKVTVKRNVSYDDDLRVINDMNFTMLNFTGHNITGLNYPLLTNGSDNNPFPTTYYGVVPTEKPFGAIIITVVVFLLLKNIFDCNVSKFVKNCINRNSRKTRLAVPDDPIEVVDMRDMNNVTTARISRSSYGAMSV